MELGAVSFWGMSFGKLMFDDMDGRVRGIGCQTKLSFL